jgi:dipeptidase
MSGKRFLGFLLLVSIGSLTYPCTLVLVGKKASADGSVLSGHNNDLPGKVASLLDIVPGKRHRTGEIITLGNGLQIPQVQETFRMLVMQCYYGFAEGDAVAVNQFGVSIAGGESLKDDRNETAREVDPLIPGGVSGHIRYIALQRAKTARQCVEIIGSMYSRYGVSYPSAVGVADTKEAWYIEAAGGKIWAAVRVPDDCYLAAANGFRIGVIDLEDNKNTIVPSYMNRQLVKKRLMSPGQRKLHFAATFGGGSTKTKPFYNSRRVWRIQQLLTPSEKQNPDANSFPLFMKPDSPIDLASLANVLRDHYQNTRWDTAKNTAERPIGYFNTVHTDMIQLRPQMPVEIGAVMWAGVGSSLASPYTPYYFGIQEIPLPYGTAGKQPDRASAYRNFRELTNWLQEDFAGRETKILREWKLLENKLFQLQPEVERCALAIYRRNPERAGDYLSIYTGGLAWQALQTAREMRREH